MLSSFSSMKRSMLEVSQCAMSDEWMDNSQSDSIDPSTGESTGENTLSQPIRSPIISNGGNTIDVHVTQPCSIPSSPVTTPRPGSAPNQRVPTSPLVQNSLDSSTSSSPLYNAQQQSTSSYSHHPSKNLFSSEPSCAAKSTKSNVVEHPVPNWDINSTLVDNWQALMPSLRERNAVMCNNELMSDIHFVVSNNGDEEAVRFPAHKYVLAIGSPVFYAMFYGSLAETGEEIVVPDVEPGAFLKMLRYLYADDIELDEDSVVHTLHVAKKYMIPTLAKACVQFMEISLTAKNACVLLSHGRMFDEPELTKQCWEVIDAQAELALTSDGFMEIDHATLTSILSRETLNCKEIHIFNAAIKWAEAECERNGVEVNPKNIRAALGSTLRLIRVLAMELQEFANGPAQTEIYTLEEMHNIFLNFTAKNKPAVEFPIEPRSGLEPQVCHRFQSSAYRSNQWRYRGRCDSILFSVDHRIFIVGFGLYGSSRGAKPYGVQMELKKHGRVLSENRSEFFSDGSSCTFHVYFKQPVQIDPDTYYTASVILDGEELSYFGQEGMTDVTVGQVTFQFQCSPESTNGTGVQGGQIPELVFYGPSSSIDEA